MVKINVDASWKTGESKGDAGIVVRDSRKMCLKVRRKEVFASSAIMAEAMTVLEGCLLARQCNYHQIMVEFNYK